jgi:membrane-bound lytic murein transglycosylase D
MPILGTLFALFLGAASLWGEAPPGRPLRLNQYYPLPGTGEEYRPSPRPPSFPGINEALTQYYIRRYSSPGELAWLRGAMTRGGPYLAFIRREIEARKLPPELLYLPVIESAYLSTAVSSRGAAGLWQFMENSIAPFNMAVNEWVDERMDFWKSTDGALRKLKENYETLGDWPLALAAYNAGMGAVGRTMKQSGIGDYWTLSEKKLLKTETIHYVPKLLAVSHILSNPRQFGLDPGWVEDPAWTRIRVGKAADLEILAREAGIDGDELKRANRELRYGITPPDPEYHLKARAADAPALREVLERPDLALIRYYFHTIQYGDTLSALARHYGVTVEGITEANPGVRAQYLKIGQRLRIPALVEAGPYQGRRSVPPAAAFEGSHLVKSGETLWSIALIYHTDPETLAEVNGMTLNDILREGRSLKTPILK